VAEGQGGELGDPGQRAAHLHHRLVLRVKAAQKLRVDVVTGVTFSLGELSNEVSRLVLTEREAREIKLKQKRAKSISNKSARNQLQKKRAKSYSNKTAPNQRQIKAREIKLNKRSKSNSRTARELK